MVGRQRYVGMPAQRNVQRKGTSSVSLLERHLREAECGRLLHHLCIELAGTQSEHKLQLVVVELKGNLNVNMRQSPAGRGVDKPKNVPKSSEPSNGLKLN